MSDLLAAALDYAARGLTVFPTNCNTAGNIYTAVVRLALMQRLWLRQFEATQGRRDDCW